MADDDLQYFAQQLAQPQPPLSQMIQQSTPSTGIGKQMHAQTKQHPHLYVSFMRLQKDLLTPGMVIMFQTISKTRRRRFNYVAIWTNNHWYITGRGEWYGTNALTHEQMLEALQRPDLETFGICGLWHVDSNPYPF